MEAEPDVAESEGAEAEIAASAESGLEDISESEMEESPHIGEASRAFSPIHPPAFPPSAIPSPALECDARARLSADDDDAPPSIKREWKSNEAPTKEARRHRKIRAKIIYKYLQVRSKVQWFAS